MNQPVLLYMTEIEEVKSRYEKPRSVEVNHLYQMMWSEDTLIFRYVGRNKPDEKSFFDPGLAWRYALRAGSNDYVFGAKDIRELFVFVPQGTDRPQRFDLSVEVRKQRLLSYETVAVEETHTFFICPGSQQSFLDMIREYSACANLELKEADRRPEVGKGGKALMWVLLAMWIVGLLTCVNTPGWPGLMLLSLLPGFAAFLLMLLFPDKLVSRSERRMETVRMFAQISIIGFAILPLFPTGHYEILNGLRLWECAVILGVILAALLLLRIRVWKVQLEYWIVPLIAVLVFSFGVIQHVNFAFDAQNARCVETTISDKRIAVSGRRDWKTYYFAVEAEGHRFEKDVMEDWYDARKIGDPAEVFFYEGALGIEMAVVNIE